jgi:flagellar biogenesis protein FliO
LIKTFARFLERFRRSPLAQIKVAAAQPLGQHATVYVIDIDGNRTVFAAGPHALCLLARYQVPTPAIDAAAGHIEAAV